MKYISEERLEELLSNKFPIEDRVIIRDIINECTELNPWQPIDENTPEDREILLCCSDWDGTGWTPKKVGGWDNIKKCWYIYGASWTPSHWCELPEDPE